MAVYPISWPQANFNSNMDFTPIAGLGDTYRAAQKRDALSELGKQLAAGTISYQEAAGRLGEQGDIGNSLKFLQLAEARRLEDLGLKASADFGKQMSGAVGPVPPAAARGVASLPDDSEPPAPPPRTPVEPIPGVVRTNPDGSIAGNITAPTIPAQAAPPAPVQPPPVAPGAPVSAAPPIPPDQAALDPRVRSAQAAAPPSMMTEGPKI
jgi:hypothetical protein